MRVKFLRLESAESVIRESGRIVDEQSDRREPSAAGEDPLGAIGLGKVRDYLHCFVGNDVIVTMNMGNDRPAVGQQRLGDGPADALAGSGDNCGAISSHRGLLSLPARRRNDAGVPERRPPIDLKGLSLADLQREIDARRLPPVDQWNPSHCGDSEMRIARDGTWYHQGQPIPRPTMVRLFTTILRREPDGRHVLVTPVEKLDIEVEATAFRAVEMSSEGEGAKRRVALKLDSGDALIVGEAHPLSLEPTPRVLVRHGLEAELSRPIYYELAEIALAEGHEPPGIWSDGAFFALHEGR